MNNKILSSFTPFTFDNLNKNYFNDLIFLNKVSFDTPIFENNTYLFNINISNLKNCNKEIIMRNLRINIDDSLIDRIEIYSGLWCDKIISLHGNNISALRKIMKIENKQLPIYLFVVGLLYPVKNSLLIKIYTKSPITNPIISIDFYLNKIIQNNSGIIRYDSILTYLNYVTYEFYIEKLTNNIIPIKSIVNFFIIDSPIYNSWIKIKFKNYEIQLLPYFKTNNSVVYKIADLNFQTDIDSGLNFNPHIVKIDFDNIYPSKIYVISPNKFFYSLSKKLIVGNYL
jgi:hypothetical protein